MEGHARNSPGLQLDSLPLKGGELGVNMTAIPPARYASRPSRFKGDNAAVSILRGAICCLCAGLWLSHPSICLSDPLYDYCGHIEDFICARSIERRQGKPVRGGR